MPPDKSAKQRPEPSNDPINQIHQMLKEWEDWANTDTFRFVERYTEFKCHILIRFRMGRFPAEFIAILHRGFAEHGVNADGGKKINHRLLGKLGGKFLEHSWRDAMCFILSTNSEQESVFVDIVKVVQAPERPVSREHFTRTFVRFDCADKVYSVLPQALYFSNSFGFVLRGGRVNRETDFRILNTRTPRVEELTDYVIKGAPQISQHIPNNSGDFWRNGLRAMDVINQLPRLRVALSANVISIGVTKSLSVNEPIDSRLQVTEVLFGSLNFYAD
jgi:hypothetical protein